MEVDMVANMVVDKMIDMVVNMEVHKAVNNIQGAFFNCSHPKISSTRKKQSIRTVPKNVECGKVWKKSKYWNKQKETQNFQQR